MAEATATGAKPWAPPAPGAVDAAPRPPLRDRLLPFIGPVVVFIVWDEPTPMPLLVVAPAARPAVLSTSPWDHYSLLRTTEDLLNLGSHLGHANTATSMRSAFNI